MSSDPQPSATAALSPPHMRTARFDDYPRIQRLAGSYLQATRPADDWPKLWLNNPLWPRLASCWPIGWVLEDAAGEVVGCLGNVPSLYRFGDRELICANGREWVVTPEYRGYALWLMDEYFNQPGVDLFINTTVKDTALPVVSAFSSRMPLGDWENFAYRVIGYRNMVRRALTKMHVPSVAPLSLPLAAGLWLKDAVFSKRLPAAPAGFEVSAADGFNARFDVFWAELVRQNREKLLAVRDSETLAWHFYRPLSRGRLWIFTAMRDGLLRAYCIVKRQDLDTGLRRMRLIDYQTVERDVDLLPALLRAALARCVAEGFDVLEHLGCGLPKMRSFDRFAPYRRRLPNWPYFYHATDPAVAAELERPEAWDPSAFDGDASYE